MKYILLVALMLPLYSWSQDCKLNKETDPYTKETKLSTGFIKLNGGSVTIDAEASEIDVFFSIEGTDKCFDNNSTATIFFEGSKLKTNTRNNGSMNCEGFFHFTFRNTVTTTALLQKLTTQNLASILFTGNNKKESKITLVPEQQQKLLSSIACLVNEAKTLIKQ